MAGFDVQGPNMARVAAQLGSLDNHTEDIFLGKMRSTVENAANTARGLAPKRSGALAASIHSSPVPHGCVLWADSDYALIHEYGGRHPVFGRSDTVYQTPRPYMGPAVSQHTDDITRDGVYTLREAARRAGFR